MPRAGIFRRIPAATRGRPRADETEESALTPLRRPRSRAACVVAVLLAIAVPGVVVGMSGSASVHFRDRQSGGDAKPGTKAGDRPNIVIIQTDDQTVEQMAAMPHVNELLGRKGTTYTQYVASYPLCCPSRATLLTGMYAHNTGVQSNIPPHGGYDRFRQGETLPVWLGRAGYATGHFGKFLNGYGRINPREVPLGWDEWMSPPGAFQHDYLAYRLNVNGVFAWHEREPEDHVDDVYTEAAVDFVRRRAPDDQPFFLALDYLAPHEGTTHEAGRCGRSARPAARHLGHFRDLPLPRPPSFDELDVGDKPGAILRLPQLTPNQIAVITEDYQCRRESLLAVDEGVRRVVDALRATGELDDTYIVFLSDNGYFQGEHRVPMGKRRVYDVATRVPFVIRGPGVAEDKVVDDPVANVDVAPTLLEAAGATAEVPELFALDGRSLLPQLTAEDPADAPVLADRALLQEIGVGYASSPGYHAVRTRQYVYVEYVTGERELYDLARDPFQLESRHADPAYAGVQAALQPVLGALRACVGRACDQSVEPPEPAPGAPLADRTRP